MDSVAGQRLSGLWRSRWAAIGAAIAVTFGGGGMVAVNAASSAPSSIVTIDPVRILDTRDPVNVGLPGPFVSAVSQKLQVTGSVPTSTGTQTPVPAGATGVLLNVTVVAPTAAGFLSVRPGDATGAPSTSSLNFTAGAIVPNSVQVGLPTAGVNAGKIDITFDAFGQAGPTTDVLIDVVGYTVAGGAGTGPAGPAGATGPAGPACPVAGCSLVYNGYSSQVNNALSTLDNANGCRSMAASSAAYLDLPLPAGAKITAITVRYNDSGATGSQFFDLFMVTDPGSSEVNMTNGVSLISTNGAKSGNLAFSTTPPPVSASAAPYIFAVTNGTGQKFCGAVVTYTF